MLRAVTATLLLAIIGIAGCAQESVPQTDDAPAPAVVAADPASEISGLAVVVDGDTIRIGERTIRFDGIDAPEEGSMCGETNMDRAATDALREATRAGAVTCRISDVPDQYGRDIAQCRAGAVDLNEHMVVNGWARDWPRYSGGAYADEEATARAAQRGVWAANCQGDLWGGRDYSP